MNKYENFRHGENEALYSRDFFNIIRGHRYAAEPAASTEFSISSVAELISPADVPFESNQSRPRLVSLASPLPVAPSLATLTIGDSEGESSSTSLAKGLRSKGLDCMPLFVLVLILCLFITLSIWATALVENDLRESHVDPADDVDAGLHFAKFGDLKPSLDLSNHETTRKQGLKITARTMKRTSTTLDYADISTMTPGNRRVDGVEDDRERTSDAGGKYAGELVEAWTSETEDMTAARPQRRAHSRRRSPREKPNRRFTRRIHRRRHVWQQSVPRSDYAEK